MKTGLILNEPDSTYFNSGAYGSTHFKDYLKDSYGFKMKYIDKLPEFQLKPTPAMQFGSLFDFMITEYFGELADDEGYAVIPPEFATQTGLSKKKDAQEWATQQGDKLIVTQKDYDKASLMRDLFLEDSNVQFFYGQGEMQAVCRDNTDLPIQAKFDCLVVDSHIGVDTKTTSNIDKFKWAVRDFGYDIQAYHYAQCYQKATGNRLREFYFAVIETQFPFRVQVYDGTKFLFDSEVKNKWQVAYNGIKNQVYGRQTNDIIKL